MGYCLGPIPDSPNETEGPTHVHPKPPSDHRATPAAESIAEKLHKRKKSDLQGWRSTPGVLDRRDGSSASAGGKRPRLDGTSDRLVDLSGQRRSSRTNRHRGEGSHRALVQ